jgi:segregation and condensation protein B
MTMAQVNSEIPEELTQDDAAKGRSIIEAVLTASDVPVTTTQFMELVGDKTGAKEVRQYVDDLNEVYIETGRAFRITEVAGGFQYSVHHEFAPWIRRLLREKPARLSQAALEVLSIVAFKQPITKAEVEHIRGVVSDGVLRHLMEKGLVRMAGRSDAVGRPLLYGTARDFLKFFGLKTLADLPKVREVEEMLREEQESSGVIETSGPDSHDGQESDSESTGGNEIIDTGADSVDLESDQETEGGDQETADQMEGQVMDAEDDEGVNTTEELDQSEEGEAYAGAAEQISGEGGSRIEESV